MEAELWLHCGSGRFEPILKFYYFHMLVEFPKASVTPKMQRQMPCPGLSTHCLSQAPLTCPSWVTLEQVFNLLVSHEFRITAWECLIAFLVTVLHHIQVSTKEETGRKSMPELFLAPGETGAPAGVGPLASS